MREEFAIDWIKRIRDSKVIKYHNDEELSQIWSNDKFIEFDDPMPSELFNGIVSEIHINSVMLTQSGNSLKLANREDFERDLNSKLFSTSPSP